MSTSDNAIVVTGIGCVCGAGRGVDRLWERLGSGGTTVGEFSRFDHGPHRTHLAAEVPGVDVHVTGTNRSRRLTLADRFALLASEEAVAQAGLDSASDRGRVGVFFGSSTGGFFESEVFYGRLIRAESGSASLSLLCAQQYNGPGDAVARRHGATGPVETLSSACTSGALAVGAALDALRHGEAEVALAGGSDSLCQLTYAGFNSLRAVDPQACRPFRADRAGLSLGEGAAVLALETLANARKRGARVLAELGGAGSTCDAHHMTAPMEDGSGAARAIRQALSEAEVDPEEVDFVNLHGTGTPHNDSAEWAALRAVFGERAGEIPVTSTKGVVGHLLGSAGAIEAVVTVLTLLEETVHPTPGPGPVDPELPARLVLGEPLPLPGCRVGLSTNLAFGGSNAALVFRRPRP